MLLGLVIVLPAAFNPGGVLAFEPLKASVLRAGAVMLASLWLLRGDPVAAPSAAGKAAIVLVAIAAVSTAFGVQPAVGFFGSFDRGTGWLTLLACGMLLFAAADLARTPAARERLLAAVALGAVVPCGYALVQRLGLDPIVWTTRGAPGSSLASPTFLGGYLVLVAPIAAYKMVHQAQRGAGLRYAGWLALLLVTCAVTLMSTIRGPILGLVLGLVTFAALTRGRRGVGLTGLALAVGAVIVAIALAVVLAGGSGVSGLARFANIARLGDSSVERLTVWRDALRIPLGDAPWRAVIGFGPDSQQVVLERGEATMRLTQNQQWDRAHNVVLDAWLTGGSAGVLAVLAFAAAFGWSAWRAGGLLRAALLGALVGHVVEQGFAFETVTSSAVFWVLAGVATRPAGSREVGTRTHALRGVVAVVIGVLLLPVMAATAVADGLYGAARRTELSAGARLEEFAAAWAPWVEELPRAAGLDWLQIANRRDDAIARQRGEANLRAASARAPEEPLPHLRLVRFYLSVGDLGAAEEQCQQALRTGPYRAAVWDACADVASRQGLTDLAPTRRARADDLRRPL